MLSKINSHNEWDKIKEIIVGTGKMSKLAGEYFLKMGYQSIIFFSNNPDKRKDFSKKYNSAVLPLKELKSYIKKYKFVILFTPLQSVQEVV